MSRVSKAVVIFLVAAGVGLAGWFSYFWYLGVGDDQFARWVAQKIYSQVAGTQSTPESRQLLADIRRFRTESAGMEPKKAAEAWMDLYTRARAMQFGKVEEWDVDTMDKLGMASVLAALPGPQAWPALREAAEQRAKTVSTDAGALAVRYVAEQLMGDHKSAAATLAEIERNADSVKDPVYAKANAAYLRAEAARLYGTREEIAAAFVASLAWSARPGREVEVPDLVGLVGEAKAKEILRGALARPAGFHVPEGQATRVLARRTALEMVDKLAAAQWGLVDSVEAAPLYEALDKRFPGGEKQAQANRRRSEDRRGTADTYYFLYLVINGRNAEAEKQLARLGSGLTVPKRTVEALGRGGQHEALYQFLHDLLGRRPEMRVWEVYLREAALTGHSAEALALVDGLLERKDLGAELLADLKFRRANALLAADQVDAGIAELRGLLAEPPKRDEKNLEARSDAAIRLAGLGRVLERRELSDQGLAFAKAVLALPPAERYDWQRQQLLRETFAEQRKSGRAAEAEALAKAQLTSKFSLSAINPFSGDARMEEMVATTELASLHGAAQRHPEVLALIDGSTAWAVRDLRGLMHQKDSLDVPLPLIAARALAATGRKETAVAIARATVEAYPGQDAGYELEAAIDKDAHEFLDRMYAADQFEERPLIWKAVLYVKDGRNLEAESVIRRAITIDPSDGEEGPNDRMRAYAVLADVLEARGAKDDAALFRRAVAAIRISERSDELHKLGLYQRAFAGYRSALEQFADAYCIQSRLAIRLTEQGRREEAFQHYRRAYELMPASFGRVESHCFGCESVFDGEEQQSLAEKVFNQLLAKDPQKPQIHYLLGYLQKERGRYPEAVKRFGESVRLDPEYLNAWKHLNDLGARVYIPPAERDVARMKLLQLDPRKRHVQYELNSVGDLAALWVAVEKANAATRPAQAKPLYTLKASAAEIEKAQAKIPVEALEQMRQYEDVDFRSYDRLGTPQVVLGKHRLINVVARLADPPY